MIDEKKLQAAIDRSEIINLVSKSIIARDSGLWDQLAACYHSDAEFSSSWWTGKPSDFITAADKKLKAAHDEGGEQKHISSNHCIEINGDHATAECDLILFTRTTVNGVELDFATWSRRLHLMKKEGGEWKIWRRFAIYEKDRVDAVDPAVDLSQRLPPTQLAKYPRQLRHHLWRNELRGSEPARNLCIRGTPQESAVREEARAWIAEAR
jgi:SnoaL-like domain